MSQFFYNIVTLRENAHYKLKKQTSKLSLLKSIRSCFIISQQTKGKGMDKGVGLEIPATYTFQHKKPSKVKKLMEL